MDQTSFSSVGRESSREEDGRVRPRLVNLLGDSRVIDSKEPEIPDIQEGGGQGRPGNRCDGEGIIIIQNLRSSSAFRVHLSINGMGIEATVDTAADVTIVADHIWKEFENPPATIHRVVMHTAGKEQTLQASRVGPVDIKLGQHSSLESVYSAPIQDYMLLGLDYLKKYRAKVDLDQEKLWLHGECLPLTSGNVCPQGISKVWLLHPVTIAPNIAVNVHCRVEGATMGDFMVESTGAGLTTMPTVVISGVGTTVVCLVNLSDCELTATTTSPIGEAHHG